MQSLHKPITALYLLKGDYCAMFFSWAAEAGFNSSLLALKWLQVIVCASLPFASYVSRDRLCFLERTKN